MNVCLGKIRKELGNYEIAVFVLYAFFSFNVDGAGFMAAIFTKCVTSNM